MYIPLIAKEYTVVIVWAVVNVTLMPLMVPEGVSVYTVVLDPELSTRTRPVVLSILKGNVTVLSVLLTPSATVILFPSRIASIFRLFELELRL